MLSTTLCGFRLESEMVGDNSGQRIFFAVYEISVTAKFVIPIYIQWTFFAVYEISIAAKFMIPIYIQWTFFAVYGISIAAKFMILI